MLDGKGQREDFQVFPYDVLYKTSVPLLKETSYKEHLVSPLHGWQRHREGELLKTAEPGWQPP